MVEMIDTHFIYLQVPWLPRQVLDSLFWALRVYEAAHAPRNKQTIQKGLEV